MNDDQMRDLIHIMVNITTSLSKISVHMAEIVEKLDSIDSNLVYFGNTMEEIREDEIS